MNILGSILSCSESVRQSVRLGIEHQAVHRQSQDDVMGRLP